MISSFPPPPLILSSPSPPSRRSSPPRPLRRSSLSVPTSLSSSPVPVKTFATASCAANGATISTITVSKIYSRFIRLPSLVYVEQLVFVFFRTYHKGLYGVHGMLDIVRRLLFWAYLMDRSLTRLSAIHPTT